MNKPFLNNVKNNIININHKRNFSIDSKIIFQSKLENLSRCCSFKFNFITQIKSSSSLNLNKTIHFFTILDCLNNETTMVTIKETFNKPEDDFELKNIKAAIKLLKEKELKIKESLLEVGILYENIDFKYPLTRDKVIISTHDPFNLINKVFSEIIEKEKFYGENQIFDKNLTKFFLKSKKTGFEEAIRKLVILFIFKEKYPFQILTHYLLRADFNLY